MSTKLSAPEGPALIELEQAPEDIATETVIMRTDDGANPCDIQIQNAPLALHLVRQRALGPLSSWSSSAGKQIFDRGCVLLTLPLTLPILFLTAFAVWLTSEGSVLFLQKRVGSYGRAFTIYKFRTLIHDAKAVQHAVTTADNQPFTSIGPFLRRWKLDELPQIINVLLGQMSLVGPRPKMPQHVTLAPPCRPGITGAATIAFAREEEILDRVPKHYLDAYYHAVVLPAKLKLDAEYMARATFASDLKLIVDSALRRWDSSVANGLPEMECFTAQAIMPESEREVADPVSVRMSAR